ncbi:MAG: hypothetical protein IPK52_21970 [Chloroflexi bacterium]|nr:hypothetical protein [Chloroflexota bacterium]
MPYGEVPWDPNIDGMPYTTDDGIDGNGPPPPPQGYGTKQSADQRIASGLTPEQQRMLESLQAQFQTAAGGYYNPRIGVALARGLQNGRSPEAIMQLVNQYISENGGGGQGYDRGYTAFAQSHDGGQSLLNQLALESWGGANPYAYDPRFEPTGGTRPPRPGDPPTGGGGTRTGGLGENGGGGPGGGDFGPGGNTGGYGFDPPGGPRGDRGGTGLPVDNPGRVPDPKPGQGGGNPRGERMTVQPQGGYASAYQAQPQAQQQPSTITVRYQYGGGGGAQAAQGAKPQAYGAQAQPQRQQQAPQPTAYGTDRSNMGIQPSMQRTQSTAPTQPRYTAPMAQQAQNRQGPQGYAQGYNGAQGPRNWFGR